MSIGTEKTILMKNITLGVVLFDPHIVVNLGWSTYFDACSKYCVDTYGCTMFDWMGNNGTMETIMMISIWQWRWDDDYNMRQRNIDSLLITLIWWVLLWCEVLQRRHDMRMDVVVVMWTWMSIDVSVWLCVLSKLMIRWSEKMLRCDVVCDHGRGWCCCGSMSKYV